MEWLLGALKLNWMMLQWHPEAWVMGKMSCCRRHGLICMAIPWLLGFAWPSPGCWATLNPKSWRIYIYIYMYIDIGLSRFWSNILKIPNVIVKSCHETPPPLVVFSMFQCILIFLAFAIFCHIVSSLPLLLEICRPKMAQAMGLEA